MTDTGTRKESEVNEERIVRLSDRKPSIRTAEGLR